MNTMQGYQEVSPLQNVSFGSQPYVSNTGMGMGWMMPQGSAHSLVAPLGMGLATPSHFVQQTQVMALER